MDASALRSRRLSLVVIIAVLVAVAGVGLYMYGFGCSGRIVSCCLTTTSMRIVVDSPCSSDLKVRILSNAGSVVEEKPVVPGENVLRVNLSVLANYTVELVYKGHVIDSRVVTAEPPPLLSTGSRAVLLANGNLTLSLSLANPDSCMADYLRIVSIAVYAANSTARLPPIVINGSWSLPAEITVNTGLDLDKIGPLTSVEVYVTDNLGRTFQVTTMFPR